MMRREPTSSRSSVELSTAGGAADRTSNARRCSPSVPSMYSSISRISSSTSRRRAPWDPGSGSRSHSRASSVTDHRRVDARRRTVASCRRRSSRSDSETSLAGAPLELRHLGRQALERPGAGQARELSSPALDRRPERSGIGGRALRLPLVPSRPLKRPIRGFPRPRLLDHRRRDRARGLVEDPAQPRRRRLVEFPVVHQAPEGPRSPPEPPGADPLGSAGSSRATTTRGTSSSSSGAPRTRSRASGCCEARSTKRRSRKYASAESTNSRDHLGRVFRPPTTRPTWRSRTGSRNTQ